MFLHDISFGEVGDYMFGVSVGSVALLLGVTLQGVIRTTCYPMTYCLQCLHLNLFIFEAI